MPSNQDHRPRVGVPWRTAAEETEGKRESYEAYLRAISHAGGEPVEISLHLPDDDLKRLAESLDGIVLSGGPADIETQRYCEAQGAKTAAPDKKRERTDDFLLDHALATGKPVLAICYGVQLLNVHFGGSLLQDIPSELGSPIDHDRNETEDEAFHNVQVEGGQLADLAGQPTIQVNSSHHQSVLDPGRGLRVTGRAPDGVIEALEWMSGPAWIIGVQWHPERMTGDPLAEGLFRRLVAKARDVASER